jgi:hypothetical protein
VKDGVSECDCGSASVRLVHYSAGHVKMSEGVSE